MVQRSLLVYIRPVNTRKARLCVVVSGYCRDVRSVGRWVVWPVVVMVVVVVSYESLMPFSYGYQRLNFLQMTPNPFRNCGFRLSLVPFGLRNMELM